MLEEQGYDWLRKAQEAGEARMKEGLERIAKDVERRILDLRSELAARGTKLSEVLNNNIAN
jgi:hypothetical protein